MFFLILAEKEITIRKEDFDVTSIEKMFYFDVYSVSFQNAVCKFKTHFYLFRFWMLICLTSLLCFHIHSFIHSLLIYKDLCECQNVSLKFPCVLLFYFMSVLHTKTSSFSGKYVYIIYIFTLITCMEVLAGKLYIGRTDHVIDHVITLFSVC